MAVEALPDDVVNLFTHVELNQSGWWDRALERLVLAILATSSASTVNEISLMLQPLVRSEIANLRVQASVDRLVSERSLTLSSNGKVTLTESAAKSLEDRGKAAIADESEVQGQFLNDCVAANLDLDPDKAWKDVNDLFVDPIVRAQGVRLYELLSTRNIDSATYQSLLAPLET